MNLMKGSNPHLFALIIFVLLVPIKTFSCSCVGGEMTIEEAIEVNDYVLTVNVVGVDTIFIPYYADDFMSIDSTQPLWEFPYIKYDVLIKEVFKGREVSGQMSIISGVGNGDCGFIFKMNMDYIVYGNSNDGQEFLLNREVITTDLCTRTRLYTNEERNSIHDRLEYISRKKWWKFWNWFD